MGQRVGYRRVSSWEQRSDRQLEGLALDELFEDRASGKDLKRPAWEEAERYLRRGDVLFVHSMDRLARNLADLLAVVEGLNRKGVEVRFVRENLCFEAGAEANPMSRLMLSLLGAVAEFERSLILERQREGIASARQRGVYRGRKRALAPDQALGVVGIFHDLIVGVGDLYQPAEGIVEVLGDLRRGGRAVASLPIARRRVVGGRVVGVDVAAEGVLGGGQRDEPTPFVVFELAFLGGVDDLGHLAARVALDEGLDAPRRGGGVVATVGVVGRRPHGRWHIASAQSSRSRRSRSSGRAGICGPSTGQRSCTCRKSCEETG